MNRIGIAAVEPSGDALGAALIEGLKKRAPEQEWVFEGIAGPAMRAAGCHPLIRTEALSVMGLTEIVAHLPRLLKLRRQLIRHFIHHKPNLFIGVDGPDFNLGLERALRSKGIFTVHCVSPTVWAWRRRRVHAVARSANLLLTLFPFESTYYENLPIKTHFMGHPLADQIATDQNLNTAHARESLEIDDSSPVIALLPGSRLGEISRLAPTFLQMVQWWRTHGPRTRFLLCAANECCYKWLEPHVSALPEVQLIHGNSQKVMAAADIILLASGTASLEAALLCKPMLVAYRVSALSYVLLNRLVTTTHVAMPNLLAPQPYIREFLQEQVQPEPLGEALLELLNDEQARHIAQQSGALIRAQLATGAAEQAAAAILEHL